MEAFYDLYLKDCKENSTQATPEGFQEFYLFGRTAFQISLGWRIEESTGEWVSYNTELLTQNTAKHLLISYRDKGFGFTCP